MYKELKVWQKAMSLVEDIYRITAEFLKSEEFGLKAQMRRAAVSIPSNIAEGKGRSHKREFLQFIHIAIGSLLELETQVEVTKRLGMLAGEKAESTLAKCQEVGKMLYGLAGAL
jgi:four helix bundle protein